MADAPHSAEPANVEVAKARNAAKRLMDCDRDRNGLKIPGTDVPFTMGASSRAIGAVSVGLGLYFTVTLLCGALLLVLTLISCYPLLNNISESRFQQTYNLSPKASFGSSGVPCDRSYIGASTIGASTLGAHCNSNRTNNAYACPALCEVDMHGVPPTDPEYTAILNVNADAATRDQLCAKYVPCLDDALWGKQAPQAPAGTECCKLVVNDHNLGSVPAAQYWCLLAVVVVMIAWSYVLRTASTNYAAQINAAVVTVGDYTVYCKGLGKNEMSREQLVQFFAHYGEVVSAVFTTNIGQLLYTEKELVKLRKQQSELELAVSHSGGCLWPLYCLLRFGTLTANGALQAANKQFDTLNKQFGPLQTVPIKNMGEALVTFNYEDHANNCFRDQTRSLGGVLYQKLCCHQPPPVLSDGHRLIVERAPEPTDIYWENTNFRGAALWGRRILSNIAVVVILAIGGGLQAGFEQLKVNTRDKLVEEQIADFGTGETTSLVESAKEQATVRALAILAAVMIVVINSIITATMRGLTTFEVYHTRSEMEKALLLKLAISQLLNSAIVPFLVASPRDWYVSGGYIEQIFFIQLTNAFLPAVINLVDPLPLFSRLAFTGFVQTQEALDELYLPLQFSLAEKYAAIIKTLGLAVIYAPVLPASYLLGFVAMVVTHWSDKWVALRVQRPPAALNAQTVDTFSVFVWMLIPAQLAVAFVFFFADFRDEFLTQLVIGATLWILATVLPVAELLGLSKDLAVEDGGTQGASWESASAGENADASEAVSQAQRWVKRAGHMRLEAYAPLLPSLVDPELTERVQRLYKIPAAVSPADPSLLPGQKLNCGKDATRPPANRLHPTSDQAAIVDYARMQQQQQQQQVTGQPQAPAVQLGEIHTMVQHNASTPALQAMNPMPPVAPAHAPPEYRPPPPAAPMQPAPSYHPPPAAPYPAAPTSQPPAYNPYPPAAPQGPAPAYNYANPQAGVYAYSNPQYAPPQAPAYYQQR